MKLEVLIVKIEQMLDYCYFRLEVEGDDFFLVIEVFRELEEVCEVIDF